MVGPDKHLNCIELLAIVVAAELKHGVEWTKDVFAGTSDVGGDAKFLVHWFWTSKTHADITLVKETVMVNIVPVGGLSTEEVEVKYKLLEVLVANVMSSVLCLNLEIDGILSSSGNSPKSMLVVSLSKESKLLFKKHSSISWTVPIESSLFSGIR